MIVPVFGGGSGTVRAAWQALESLMAPAACFACSATRGMITAQ
jgi:hypothetical protein